MGARTWWERCDLRAKHWGLVHPLAFTLSSSTCLYPFPCCISWPFFHLLKSGLGAGYGYCAGPYQDGSIYWPWFSISSSVKQEERTSMHLLRRGKKGSKKMAEPSSLEEAQTWEVVRPGLEIQLIHFLAEHPSQAPHLPQPRSPNYVQSEGAAWVLLDEENQFLVRFPLSMALVFQVIQEALTKHLQRSQCCAQGQCEGSPVE